MSEPAVLLRNARPRKYLNEAGRRALGDVQPITSGGPQRVRRALPPQFLRLKPQNEWKFARSVGNNVTGSREISLRLGADFQFINLYSHLIWVYYIYLVSSFVVSENS